MYTDNINSNIHVKSTFGRAECSVFSAYARSKLNAQKKKVEKVTKKKKTIFDSSG
jgi:hypothetical protein